MKTCPYSDSKLIGHRNSDLVIKAMVKEYHKMSFFDIDSGVLRKNPSASIHLSKLRSSDD